MRDIIKKKTIEIIAKIIRIDTSLITESSNQNDFPKWDSLAHLTIMMKIEKQFKKKISTSKMSELNSIKKILNFLETK